MNVELVRLSTRGQLVVPQSMREELKLKAGEKLLAIEEKGAIVLKPVSGLGQELLDEVTGAMMAAKGREEIRKGKYKKMSKEAFFKEMEKW